FFDGDKIMSGRSSVPKRILRFSLQSALGVNARSKWTFVSSSRILIVSMSSQFAPAVGLVPPATVNVTVSSTSGRPSRLKPRSPSPPFSLELLLSLPPLLSLFSFSLPLSEQPMIVIAKSIIKIVNKKLLFLIDIFFVSLLLFSANNHFYH